MGVLGGHLGIILDIVGDFWGDQLGILWASLGDDLGVILGPCWGHCGAHLPCTPIPFKGVHCIFSFTFEIPMEGVAPPQVPSRRRRRRGGLDCRRVDLGACFYRPIMPWVVCHIGSLRSCRA